LVSRTFTAAYHFDCCTSNNNTSLIPPSVLLPARCDAGSRVRAAKTKGGNVGMNRPFWTPPIDSYFQVLNGGCSAIFPARLGSKTRDEETRIVSVCLRQYLVFNGATISGDSQFDIESVNEDESALGGFQSPFASSVKQNGSNPQSNCGDCQNTR